MKNILLLTDFSKNSINAIHYALQLFEDDICNFFLLHAQSPATYMSDDLLLAGNESIYNSMVAKTKRKLAKLIVQLDSEFKNEKFSYEILVDYDALPEAINQIKKSKSIDLVVMGTNGVTGAKEVVFGSNTINVIRKVHVPTLVIPEGFAYKIPEEILLPLDIKDTLSGKVFTDVLKFTKRFGKKLHVLRIMPNNEASEEALKDMDNINSLLKDIKHEYHNINNVPMNYAVDNYTQSHSIDLITLLVQKESLFERFIIGSTTTQISKNLRVPLLIFHT
ncbi:universal stress protein [Winogradskyella litoriviva]|uniref:Universal stress protein n=1 Tax=Winogradskyella litoriviva TaxID=1220182 RepID=A0ABX2EAI3_9FLAO|nr:universal stress protein [Winogradskyella litoriviva]NRD24641.1 universal stress protein [Winogradskyella litoriviva]